METFKYFFSFSDPNIRYVVLGVLLITSSSAIVGCFTFLRKRALAGDAVAHAVLPGVCLSFILSGTKNPALLIIGAFVTGWLSLVLIDFITSRTKIKEDTAIGLILSVFFGIGILMLTFIQHSGNSAQSGLDHFLFGKAASLVASDVMVFGTVALLLIVIATLLFKEFFLISFDRNFAQSVGIPVKLLELVLSSLTVLSVVVGIQAVGVVLMAAILITPAAAARFWTDNIRIMIVLAALLSAFSGLAGAYISFAWEGVSMPTGPWIVMITSLIAIFSFFAAPRKGILSRMLHKRNYRLRMMEENILKLFFQLGERDKDFFSPRSKDQMLEKRQIGKKSLSEGLSRLVSQGYLTKVNHLYKLTPEGKEKGQRVTRLHRLWEMYLSEYLKIAPDHVHEDAESIEHIITPELERKIEEQLKYPKQDPHSSEIPYKS